jgi:heat shock protein beta
MAQDDTPKKVETHTFQAEVSRLLDIIINSLYSQKEIFLREAISNANDALDKIRFLSLEDPELLKDESELKVSIEVDADKNMLILTDTGIGMTAQDLRNNLGTIARSGTTQFLEAITKTGNLNLIGQFGVGFYSYFLVANHVTVITKSPNDAKQYVWKSEAGSTYTIEEDEEGPFLTRGTRIELLLKKDAKEFLDIAKVKTLAKKYSEFIEFPIYLYTSKEVSREVEVEEEPKEEGQDDMEIKDSGDEEKKTKTVKETVWDWEQVNNEKAIWKRSADEIEDSEYVAFYKATSKDYSDPLSWVHFKAEGDINFTALLYIPKKPPQELFQMQVKEEDKKSSLKLYVRKVLISDKFDDLLPKYLAFVKGVVDSDDLPLNVSRETLQQYRSVKIIKKKVTRKVLDQLVKFSKNKLTKTEKNEELSEEEQKEAEEKAKKENDEKYLEFYAEFSRFLKHGIIEDVKNRDKIASLLRFPSTNTDSLDMVSLEEYVSRMPEEQEEIFFIAGENKQELRNHPSVRSLVKKGYEVLLMEEAIDEYCVQNLVTFSEKTISNVTKAGFKPPRVEDEEAFKTRLVEFYKPLTTWLTSTLGETVEKVELSLDTDDIPMVVKAGQFGYTANMQKMALNQPMANKKQTEEMLKRMKNVVHINPNHVIIKELLDRVRKADSGSVDREVFELAKLLYDVAAIQGGFRIAKPEKFVSNFHSMMTDNLGLSRGNKTVDLEEELSDFEKLEAAKKEAEEAEKERQRQLKEEEDKLKAEKEAEEAGQVEDEVQIEDVEGTTGEFNAEAEL